MANMKDLARRYHHSNMICVEKYRAKAKKLWTKKYLPRINSMVDIGEDFYRIKHWPWVDYHVMQELQTLAAKEGFSASWDTNSRGWDLIVGGWSEIKLEPNDILKDIL